MSGVAQGKAAADLQPAKRAAAFTRVGVMDIGGGRSRRAERDQPETDFRSAVVNVNDGAGGLAPVAQHTARLGHEPSRRKQQTREHRAHRMSYCIHRESAASVAFMTKILSQRAPFKGTI